MMGRRAFLGASIGAAVSHAIPPSAPARRPNIIVIIADDLGYADLGVHGCTDIPTPHIDSIAKNGVRFTNGYVSAPVCSPSRAGLMTGRYQQRFGHEFNQVKNGWLDPRFGLPLDEVTLARRLKLLGYSTGIFGKWHLGYRPELHPQRRGFDEFFGFLGGAHSYLDAKPNQEGGILRGMDPVPRINYTTEDFAREAVSFIERHKQVPFFVYLAFNAVHKPLECTEKYRNRFRGIQDEKRRTYAGMLSAMDDAVGAVLAKIDETKLANDTLVFFVNDNGGATQEGTSRNSPLRGYKQLLLEGGIRVAFLMQWRGRLPASLVYEHPVIALDIHPTAVAAARGAVPASAGLDGANLLPYLMNENRSQPHETLYWRYDLQSAIRKGDWKMVRLSGGPVQLYNLAEDIGEERNLAAAEPKRTRELLVAYEDWNRQLMAPRWPIVPVSARDLQALRR